MPTTVPYLRIEEEFSSQLTLVSTNRRWLVMVIAIIAAAPISFLGFMLFIAESELWIWVPLILIGVFTMMLLLIFTAVKFQLVISSGTRMLILNRHYWLGFGALESVREKSWSFNEITDVNPVQKGANRLIEIEVNKKKELILNFGRKAEDAQRAYNVLQSWLKGLAPDSVKAETALQDLASEKQTQSALKNAEKLLNYFGIFSLISGGLGLFTEYSVSSSISIVTMINLVTGFIYLVCGFGAKRKFEPALWIAIIVVLAERLYWFIMSGSVSGDGNWSSWLTWIFAFFVVSSLWKAIQSIRTMEENPPYMPSV